MIGLNGGTLGNTGALMNNDHDKVIMGLFENGIQPGCGQFNGENDEPANLEAPFFSDKPG